MDVRLSNHSNPRSATMFSGQWPSCLVLQRKGWLHQNVQYSACYPIINSAILKLNELYES